MGILEEISIESISEEVYSIEDSVIEAKQIISRLNEKETFFIGNFEFDKWRIYLDIYGVFYHFYFDYLEDYKLSSDFKTVVKCWVIQLLEVVSVDAAKRHFNQLKFFIEKTEGLDEMKVASFLDYLVLDADLQVHKKQYLLTTILNFHSYYNDETFISLDVALDLANFKNTLKVEDKGIRKLPKSSDVMLFSYHVEKYFNNIDKESKQYIRYFPIHLWWNITNKIPIRSSEFCRLKRDCIVKDEEKNYLSLPRAKTSRKGVQLIDKIAIPQDLVNEINHYITLTDEYGDSETLISYYAQHHTNTRQRDKYQYSHRKYTLQNFTYLLDEFYEKVLTEVFNLSVKPLENIKIDEKKQYDIETRLRPNDTRHLTFMSLYMQGYHPVEIARLGGHTTLDVQYSYQQHSEYWVDSEIEKLMTNFSFIMDGEKNKVVDSTVQPTLNNKFRLRAIYSPPTQKDFQLPCQYGYCTDEFQRCRTETCFECEHWRINVEEWDLAQSEIAKTIKNKRTEISGLYAFLFNLHQHILKDEFSEINYQYSNQIKQTTLRIKSHIEAITLLQKKLV